MSQSRRTSSRTRKWLTRERFKQLVPMLPALLALLFWPVMGAIALWSINSVERRYVNYADIALGSGNFNAARIACERLLQLDSLQHPVHVYRMAQALSGLGQREASMQLLAAVTSVESSALGPAHQFMAEAILRDPTASGEALKMAEYHLKQAQAVGVNPPVILERLGQYYSRIGDWAQAKKYFLQGYAVRKDLALPLAAVSKAQGDALETKRWAREAAGYFQERTEKTKRNALARADWAEALILFQDYQAAVNVLNAGIKESDMPAYHRLAAEALAAWVGTMNGKSADTLPARLNLIEQGLSNDPRNRRDPFNRGRGRQGAGRSEHHAGEGRVRHHRPFLPGNGCLEKRQTRSGTGTF
jgi:tetratricopeptide (TPR) repeat protein